MDNKKRKTLEDTDRGMWGGSPSSCPLSSSFPPCHLTHSSSSLSFARSTIVDTESRSPSARCETTSSAHRPIQPSAIVARQPRATVMAAPGDQRTPAATSSVNSGSVALSTPLVPLRTAESTFGSLAKELCTASERSSPDSSPVPETSAMAKAWRRSSALTQPPPAGDAPQSASARACRSVARRPRSSGAGPRTCSDPSPVRGDASSRRATRSRPAATVRCTAAARTRASERRPPCSVGPWTSRHHRAASRPIFSYRRPRAEARTCAFFNISAGPGAGSRGIVSRVRTTAGTIASCAPA
mmetsp:Transcript_3876/g.8148  ORF Transcript_3876/g.8148 Transcript_3876/m.8148 type:complete len:299 (-) Transcript_3876:899-1795(-)